MSDIGIIETEFEKMPQEWGLTTLENLDLFSYISGLWMGKKPPLVPAKVIRNTNFNNDGSIDYSDVAYLQVEDRHLCEKELKHGDIIIERSGGGPSQPVGRVVYFDRTEKGYSFSNFTSTLRVLKQEKVYSKFLLYYLLLFYLEGSTLTLQQKTTGIRNLNFSDYKKSPIPLPPLPEQKKIAAILSKIQQAIEVQDKIIERTKELKNALMAKLFTEGLHGEELKETEIGLMPKSWDVATVGSLAIDGIMNGAFVKNPHWGTGTRFLNVVDTYGSEQVDVNSLMRLEVGDEYRENYALRDKDVLFVRSSLKEEGIGQACFVDGLAEPVIYDCHLMRISPNLDVVDPSYLVLYCLTEQAKKGLISKSNKTTMTTINQKGLSDFPVPLALLREQKEIVHVAESLNATRSVHQSKLITLQGLFKSMLHQLMTGKIRVNNIELPFINEQMGATNV